jgi:type IV secretion system protein TrbL
MELLTDVLQAIENAALTGFGLIEADAESLALMIAKVSGFAVLVSALIAPREFSVSQPVALIISLYVIGFLMAYFQPITQSLLEMMERVGLAAGGDTVNLSSLKDVGAVAQGGWTGAGPLIHALKDKLGWDFYNYIHYIFFYLVCITLILVIHIILAYRIFFLYLEYFVVSTVAYFLLPTAAWGRTAYLAERAIGYVVSVGISLLLMGFLYSLVHQYVASIEWDADMKLIDMVSATTATVVLVVAVILAGRAVRALQQGAPTMSASYAFHQIAGGRGADVDGGAPRRALRGADAPRRDRPWRRHGWPQPAAS